MVSFVAILKQCICLRFSVLCDVHIEKVLCRLNMMFKCSYGACISVASSQTPCLGTGLVLGYYDHYSDWTAIKSSIANKNLYQLSCQLNFADINECQDGNNGGCTDRCTNTRGSYQCSCRRGYEFQREDGASGSGSVDMTVDPNTDAGRPCQGML